MKYLIPVICMIFALAVANTAEATIFGNLFQRQRQRVVRVERVVDNHHAQRVIVERQVIVPQRQRVVEFIEVPRVRVIEKQVVDPHHQQQRVLRVEKVIQHH
jgi:phosphopantothenate synthetase